MSDIILFLIILEFVIYFLSQYIRSRNQWFILNQDQYPKFSNTIIDKVAAKSFDSLLGWDRKPNTSGSEKGQVGDVSWYINKDGTRDNLEFNYQESKIAIFGDSFTFSREVNDNQTWGYKLSTLMNTNVKNFGVGNYGIDQSIIKLEQKLLEKIITPDIVILGVVPDTISRILSVWKHYYEYGNIYGFKPRFILQGNELVYVPNIINTLEKLISYTDYLEHIQKYDFFYKNKFLSEIISFPYTLGFIKNIRRNVVLTYETIRSVKVSKPTPSIMQNNLKWRVKLYQNNNKINLLVKQLDYVDVLSKKYGFKAILLFMPQKDDINYIKQKNTHFYKKFIDRVPKNILCIDAYENLKVCSPQKLNSLYSENSVYGGHFSSEGNTFIANIVYNKLNLDEAK